MQDHNTKADSKFDDSNNRDGFNHCKPEAAASHIIPMLWHRCWTTKTSNMGVSLPVTGVMLQRLSSGTFYFPSFSNNSVRRRCIICTNTYSYRLPSRHTASAINRDISRKAGFISPPRIQSILFSHYLLHTREPRQVRVHTVSKQDVSTFVSILAARLDSALGHKTVRKEEDMCDLQ